MAKNKKDDEVFKTITVAMPVKVIVEHLDSSENPLDWLAAAKLKPLIGIDDIDYFVKNIKSELNNLQNNLALMLEKIGEGEYEVSPAISNTLDEDSRRVAFMIALFSPKSENVSNGPQKQTSHQ